MDIVYARGEATAAEIQDALPDAPSYSAVRALLRILEEKGVLRHREEGQRYVYLPTQPAEQARQSALKRVVGAFFAGSLASAVASLVEAEGGTLDPGELRRLEAIIQKAKAKKP